MTKIKFNPPGIIKFASEIRDFISILFIKEKLNIDQKKHQIDLLKFAMERTRKNMKMFGYITNVYLYEKLYRQAMWLRVLLRRKKRFEEVKALEFEFGKHYLDNLEKSGGKTR